MIDAGLAVEIMGWIAAIVSLLTYSQKTMIRLRVVGIAANISMMVWALGIGVWPPVALHACLLVLNGFRLWQILRDKKAAEAAQSGEVSPLNWLKPFVKPVHYDDGDYVFRMNEAPDRLYYLVSGTVVFDEVDRRAGPGEVFGEVAFLTSQHVRTASARCEGPCEVLALDGSDLAHVSVQYPAFNVFLMRVIAERLNGGTVPVTVSPIPFHRAC